MTKRFNQEELQSLRTAAGDVRGQWESSVVRGLFAEIDALKNELELAVANYNDCALEVGVQAREAFEKGIALHVQHKGKKSVEELWTLFKAPVEEPVDL